MPVIPPGQSARLAATREGSASPAAANAMNTADTPVTRFSMRSELIAVAVLVILHIAINGYSFGGVTQRRPFTSPSSDHANIIPWVQWYADTSLYPRDFAI